MMYDGCNHDMLSMPRLIILIARVFATRRLDGFVGASVGASRRARGCVFGEAFDKALP